MRVLLVDHWPGQKPYCGSGLGSSLFKLAAAADAREAGHEIHWLTSPPRDELLGFSPVVQQAYTRPEDALGTSFDAIICLGIPVPEELKTLPETLRDSRPIPDIKAKYDRVAHLRFWRDHLAHALELSPRDTPASIPLLAPEVELDSLLGRVPPSDPVGFSLSALTNLKRYPRWGEAILNTVRRAPEVTPCLLGQDRPDFQVRDGWIDLTRRTSISDLLTVVSSCKVVAGTDGFITNLALALGIPTVALFTIIRPEFVIDPHQERRGPHRALVHEGCPRQFCYAELGNYRTAICPYQPDLPRGDAPICASFPPEKVARAVHSLLQD